MDTVSTGVDGVKTGVGQPPPGQEAQVTCYGGGALGLEARLV